MPNLRKLEISIDIENDELVNVVSAPLNLVLAPGVEKSWLEPIGRFRYWAPEDFILEIPDGASWNF
jgi:hypothetical protein